MIDDTYVQARRTLLDALDALLPHLDALVLIGAQAVYEHTFAVHLPVAMMTTDADVALDADVLAGQPDIAALDASLLRSRHRSARRGQRCRRTSRPFQNPRTV